MSDTDLIDSDAIAAFVESSSRAFLFCRDETGDPIGYAMNVIGFARGALYFTTYTKSRKIRQLRADPEAACVVVGSDVADAWLSVHGSAELHERDERMLAEVRPMIVGQLADPRVPHAVIAKALDRVATGKRIVIRLVVDEAFIAPGVSSGSTGATR